MANRAVVRQLVAAERGLRAAWLVTDRQRPERAGYSLVAQAAEAEKAGRRGRACPYQGAAEAEIAAA